jgi:hypothetical protein
MTNNSAEPWGIEPTSDNRWCVRWPADWIPVNDPKSLETLIDVSFQSNTGDYSEITFYMETTQGEFTHWISPELWLTKGMANKLSNYWCSLEARVWGVGYPKRAQAENFMYELSKRYTLYLLKEQY